MEIRGFRPPMRGDAGFELNKKSVVQWRFFKFRMNIMPQVRYSNKYFFTA
jgi:hypothetical protein